MKIIAVDYPDEHIAEFKRVHTAVEFIPYATASGQPLPSQGAEALIAWGRAAFDKVFLPETFKTHPEIRWYHAPGAGVEFYMHPGLEKQSFTLTCGKIIQGPEVADHAVALLLGLTRRFGYAFKNPTGEIPRGVELRGKLALVIGFGGIGMLVAERLSGFGMRIQTVTEDNFPLISFVEKRWLADQLQEALPPADVVIMCAPYTKSSKKMMGREAFAAMKNGAYFVNVSRGGPVDTEALLDALNSGHVAGAGLDVTDPEPLPSDHPFFTMPNVLHSPHLAGISDNLRERNLELVSTNIRRFVKGLPLINVVDKALGY